MKFDTSTWQTFKSRAQELNEELVKPGLDNQRRAALQKELSHLSQLLTKHEEVAQLEEETASLERDLAANTEAEMAALIEEELIELKQRHFIAANELDVFLFPPDERDDASVFLEIRAGAGGAEAALFAADLGRMYMLYAEKKRWRASVASESFTDLGGYRELVLHIEGRGVYGHLKFESGVHRVQRVPATETAGRIHTSTATVAVLPEVEEIEKVEINPTDLRIDVYRAGGAGGQHVNKTDSAVRITHLPTGLVVACQEDRSQHKNKAKAMKLLKMRLLEAEREKQEAEQTAKRREQVGGGMRAEKVRTYNYPQNRVTDHQVNVTLSKLDMVMQGELEDIIVPLMEQEHIRRKQEVAYPFS